MQKKNEWKIGCHTLSKTKCGSLIVTDQLGDKHLYRINRNEFGALKDFLSTPYQEEEVYVNIGMKVRRKSTCTEYLVSSTGDGKVTLVNSRHGSAWTRPVSEDFAITLQQLIGEGADISEWEVIK